jgi:hypothetical protein
LRCLHASPALERRGIEQLHGAAACGERERFAVRADGESARRMCILELALQPEGPHEPPISGEVPKDHATVVACTVERTSVGGDGERPDRAAMTRELLSHLAAGDVPHDYLSLDVRRDECPAVGRKCHVEDAGSVPARECTHCARVQVEQANPAVTVSHRQRAAVGAQRTGEAAYTVPVQNA